MPNSAHVTGPPAGVTWPEAKAPALQRTLRAVTEQRGGLDLHSLHTVGFGSAAVPHWNSLQTIT